MSICMYFTDTLYPMDITMSRVCLGSDTCDLYFSYIKVNHLLYTCSLDPFEDGILLDTPLVCMRRYCRSFTDGEEECKRQGSPTPSAREAWKRRRKKTELLILQRPDIRPKPRTSGAPRSPGHPAASPDIRPCLRACIRADAHVTVSPLTYPFMTLDY